MKKLTLITTLLLVTSFGLLTAQSNKGNTLVGISSSLNLVGSSTDVMTLGFSSIKQKSNASGFSEPEPDKMTSFNVLPKVGYFIIDDLAIGLDLSYSLAVSKNGETNSKSTYSLFGAGPFVRYYLPAAKVLPYFELNSIFGISKSKYESDNSDNESTSSLTSLGGAVGIAAPLGDKVTFDVSLGYNSLIIKEKEDNPDNDRTVVGTVGLKLGFTIFFGTWSN